MWKRIPPLASRLYGFTALRLYGFTALRLYGEGIEPGVCVVNRMSRIAVGGWVEEPE